MIHVTEIESAKLISHELAFEAAREALIAAVAPATSIFPVVLGHASDKRNRFTVKSAADRELAGFKVGSYFATNDAAGLPRHSSIIFLFDQDIGRIGAIIEGTVINGYRTAAADAVAVDALARNDAETLTVFGTGHQAAYEVAAVARVRALRRILVVGRTPERVSAFIGHLASLGIEAQASDAESACKAADIIVTITTSHAPLFEAEWVRPGTHISSMGSDAVGKQELPTAFFSRARLFTDLPEQSRRIGEFQHAQAGDDIFAIGSVLSGATPGRQAHDDVTIFDSSGISIQDLYVARKIIQARLGTSS